MSWKEMLKYKTQNILIYSVELGIVHIILHKPLLEDFKPPPLPCLWAILVYNIRLCKITVANVICVNYATIFKGYRVTTHRRRTNIFDNNLLVSLLLKLGKFNGDTWILRYYKEDNIIKIL